MIILEQALVRVLSAFKTDLLNVHGITLTNYYPSRLPQGVAFPAIVYRVARDKPVETHSGTDRLSTARVRFMVYSPSYMQASQIRSALVEYLAGNRFPLAWTTNGTDYTFEIRNFRYENGNSFVDNDTTIEIQWVDFLVDYWRNIAPE
jgi:hypothetical protein